jgi:hypothetical protein
MCMFREETQMHAGCQPFFKRDVTLRSQCSSDEGPWAVLTNIDRADRLRCCCNDTVNWNVTELSLEHLRKSTRARYVFYCVSEELLASSCLLLGSLTAKWKLLSVYKGKRLCVEQYRRANSARAAPHIHSKR